MLVKQLGQTDVSSYSIKENPSVSEKLAGKLSPLDTGVQDVRSVACHCLLAKVTYSINQSCSLYL